MRKDYFVNKTPFPASVVINNPKGHPLILMFHLPSGRSQSAGDIEFAEGGSITVNVAGFPRKTVPAPLGPENVATVSLVEREISVTYSTSDSAPVHSAASSELSASMV